LSELVAQGKLGDFSSVARTVPSQKRQTENRALLSEALLKPHLSSFLRSIGGNSEFGYQDAEPGTLTPQQLADSGGAAFLDLLILQSSDRAVVHMVSLSGVRDIPALEQIGRDREDIRFMDQGREWSSVMQIYRVRALSLLAVAVGLVWAFLSFRYRPLQAAKLIAAPLVAVVSTPLILAAFGGSFTFFNAMALLLVFVIGLDYALFYAEATEDHRDISFFANALSALSTILAFGLMSFSQVYAVHAFGITILVGITLAFVFSPLAARNA
jgi:predicted exporter